MSFQHRSFWAGLVAAVLLVLATPAQATILGTYNSRATWEGLTSGRTDIDFSTLGLAGPGSIAEYGTAAGLTVSSVNFVGVHAGGSYGGYQLTAGFPASGASDDYGSGPRLVGPEYHTSGSYLRATLPSGVTAFAIELATINPAAQSFRLLVDGVDIGSVINAQAHPNRTFIGVRTDTPIAEVRIVMNSGTQWNTRGLFDNVSYGSSEPPAETPEATSFLYMATGIGLISWTIRRRRAASV